LLWHGEGKWGREEEGKRGDLKGADSAGSVRADAVFFEAEIVVSQSILGFDEGVSHVFHLGIGRLLS
jgi:hypothetical protein